MILKGDNIGEYRALIDKYRSTVALVQTLTQRVDQDVLVQIVDDLAEVFRRERQIMDLLAAVNSLPCEARTRIYFDEQEERFLLGKRQESSES